VQSQTKFVVICLTVLTWSPHSLFAQVPLELNPHTPDLTIRSVEPAAFNGISPTPFGLTRQDLNVLREMFPTVPAICPTRKVRTDVRVDHHTLEAHLVGTSSAYQVIHGVQISRGRFLTDEDILQRRNVAVMGEQQAQRLFQDVDPIGQSIRVGHDYYLIVGLIGQPLKRIGDRDANVFIPFTTMWARLGDLDSQRESGNIYMKMFELSSIEFQLNDDTDRRVMMRAVRQVLETLHDDQTYTIDAPSEAGKEVVP